MKNEKVTIMIWRSSWFVLLRILDRPTTKLDCINYDIGNVYNGKGDLVKDENGENIKETFMAEDNYKLVDRIIRRIKSQIPKEDIATLASWARSNGRINKMREEEAEIERQKKVLAYQPSADM